MSREEIIANVSAYIKKYRRLCNVSQIDLAKASGLDVGLLLSYEKGRRCPSIFTLLKLANAMGVTCNDVIFNGRVNETK